MASRELVRLNSPNGYILSDRRLHIGNGALGHTAGERAGLVVVEFGCHDSAAIPASHLDLVPRAVPGSNEAPI